MQTNREMMRSTRRKSPLKKNKKKESQNDVNAHFYLLARLTITAMSCHFIILLHIPWS